MFESTTVRTSNWFSNPGAEGRFCYPLLHMKTAAVFNGPHTLHSSTLLGIPCIRFPFRYTFGFPSRRTRTQPGTFIAVGSRLVLLCIGSAHPIGKHWQSTAMICLRVPMHCTSLLFDSSPVCQWESFSSLHHICAQVYLVFSRFYAPVPDAAHGYIAFPEEHQLPVPPTVPSRQKTPGETVGNCESITVSRVSSHTF